MSKEPHKKERPEPKAVEPPKNDTARLELRMLDLEKQIEDCTKRIKALAAEHVAQSAQLTELLKGIGIRRSQGPLIPQQGYLAGQWHRRDGTVYGRSALQGSPNANNPTGAVQPPKRR